MRRPAWPDVLVALVLVTWSTFIDVGLHPWPQTVVGALWVGSLALRSVSPTAMMLVASAAIVGFGVVATAADTPFLGALVVSFAAGYSLVGRRLLALSGVYLAAGAVMDALLVSHQSVATRVISILVIVGAPIVVGAVTRRTRAQTAELRRLHAELDDERQARARIAANAERTRIARDLHDVVAHSVSAMVVQAGAAEQLLGADDPAREPLLAVRRAGKETLAELRRQLGVLRAVT